MTTREVELTGGAPWGFRMHGGVDQNQPLKISRVNPGRKASLCGVREGDVISSINGRATRGMSNADAHAMLRGAGPVLRLGLNEDREMSPRRRSISKGSELKRPSQLLASTEEATLQEPVYATIKPPITQAWSPSSPLRSSLNSLPALNSTPLVKSAAPVEQPLKFHPTNPFYTTLPSNYTSASKLPISNGKTSISTLDRNKTKSNNHSTDLKSPSYFTASDFGSSSHINSSNFSDKINGFGFNANSTAKSYISYDNVNRDKPSLPNESEMKNPFRSNRINSDPFEKYLNPEHKFNGTFESETKNMTNSMSDNSFHKSKEITERSTITEHKISEIEEVKTIKKIVLNGSGGESDRETKRSFINGERKSFGLPEPQPSKEYYQGSTQQSTRNEHFSTTPTQSRNDNLRANNQDGQNSATSSTKYHFVHLNNDVAEDSSATESDDSSHSGREKTVNGESLTKKYIDPKRRTINKVSKKILKAIEKLTCNIKRNKKGRKVVEPKPVKNAEPLEPVTAKPPTPAPAQSSAKRITSQSKKGTFDEPSSLKDLCVQKVAAFPYGEKILEELASVSKRLQNITICSQNFNSHDKTTTIGSHRIPQIQLKENMPYYPLPDVSSIEKVTLPSKDNVHNPPPVQPRNSSLKLSQDDNHWVGVPTETEPVYVCLSPSQKMLMEKTNTVITKEDASQLVDMHKKYVDRRGYNEYYGKEIRKENQRPDNPPVVPFKSQTGSRLLALIRDPAVTDNMNSIKSKNQLKILDQIGSIDKKSQEMSFKKQDYYNSANNLTSNLKPVPPPRTRKFSSSIYESDESDFTDSSFRSIKSERKSFHYSTGNLSKEIENDISSIQNMHRYYTDFRDQFKDQTAPRRPSLPKDLCDQQMEYIRRKEKEVEAEIRRLENEKLSLPVQMKQGPRAPLISEAEVYNQQITRTSSQSMLLKKDSELKLSALKTPKVPEKPDKGKLSVFSSSQEELLREKMYSEYVNQMAEREERRQQKVIKITNNSKPVTSTSENPFSKSMPALDFLDSKVNNRIEKEFIWRARERWNKLGIKDPETEDERDENNKDVYKEPKVVEHKIKVIEGGEEKDVKKLPSHLQEFVRFTVKDSDQGKSSPAVWRPGAPTPPPAPAPVARSPGAPPPPPPPPPVWTPGASPQTPRKSFRPVHFEETPPSRRKFGSSEQNGCTSGSESEGRLRTSHSAPATGLNSLGNSSSRLPRAQNPTVTLLQKAREGQLSRGSSYLQQERDSARLPRDRVSPPKGDPIHALRREYASEGEADRSDYERGGPRKMAHTHEKVEGIGPTTKDGMPVALRSEVRDQSKWYKKMYDTIHKNKYDDDFVTIRYKSRRGQPPQRVTNKSQYAYFDPRSGYLSEPEGGLSRLGSSTWSDAYDSDVTNSPRRRTTSVQEERRHEEITSPYLPSNKYSTLASARASQEVYKNQPGKIENYVPGRSSVVDKEAKQWWDEVMDIFDGQISAQSTTSLPQASPKEKKDITSAILSKSNMARALKESGYESDSTLVFRRRDDTEGPLSPAERRAAYRDLQAGGEPPLRGFRSPAPPRTETDSAPEPPRRALNGTHSDTESPRRYVESDVNIHYRCPVRHDPLPLVPERELARQQAEHMKRLYREQRRHKYLQELQDMQNRRHQDNFTPAQKSVVPLNRYDEAERIAARALYAFNGQTPRELSFRKGDLIHVRRQIDTNWYEGELHGRIGLFPYNYVEILKGDVAHSPKKPVAQEGKARAKFDFTAQTNLELPLKKGEVVVLTRRIDHNWWEGRNGSKTGIFPDSYVTILQEPSQNKPEIQPIAPSDKPVASPAAHGLLNGSAKRSMGAHSYMPTPNNPNLANAPPSTQPLPGYTTKTAQSAMTPSERGYGPPTGAGVDLNNTEPLYVDTNAEAVPYRAMYKYRPQNPDELELNEGDTVYVLEKCDDGWYVGSSQRTGRFGTFPGNYVERI